MFLHLELRTQRNLNFNLLEADENLVWTMLSSSWKVTGGCPETDNNEFEDLTQSRWEPFLLLGP